MTQDNTLKVNLSNSKPNKLKSGKKCHSSNFKSFIKFDWWLMIRIIFQITY